MARGPREGGGDAAEHEDAHSGGGVREGRGRQGRGKAGNGHGTGRDEVYATEGEMGVETVVAA